MVGLTPLLWKSCGLIIQSWLFGSPRVEINYPLFWHSSPSHYWHYIWKLSHLLGSILWFMIPTKKRNGDQIRSSFDESSYYSHYHSSHVWSVAGMQCKAILIKNVYKCLEFISKYFQPLVNSGNPLQCVLWRGNRGQGALLHKPKTSGGNDDE